MFLKRRIGKKEFITLMALMTAMTALSIDSMLPAMSSIGDDLGALDKDLPLIISMLFLGLSFGQIVFGPLSDSFGRKKPVYLGLSIFIVGSLMSAFAGSMTVMLAGRVLQGFGGAATRTVAIALIRDEYSGNAMAEITSLVMTIFILVPAFAPSLGQIVLFIGDWRHIFIVLLAVAILLFLWFGFRQYETLPKHLRRKFRVRDLIMGVRETFSKISAVSGMLISGCLFGIFIGYLGAIQIIFKDQFMMEDWFPIMFGLLALSVGSASFFNSRLVVALGMRKLLFYSLLSILILAISYFVYLLLLSDGEIKILSFMIYMIFTFFSLGFLFGNLNALAMEPLGHIAGMGSALVGGFQSLIAVFLGSLVGPYFLDSIYYLIFAFSFFAILALILLRIEQKMVVI